MERESLRQALAELVEQETGTKPGNLADDVVLIEGLGMDSIDLVGLVVQVENRFRIKIATDELKGVSKVGEFLALVEKKISAGDAETVNALRRPQPVGGGRPLESIRGRVAGARGGRGGRMHLLDARGGGGAAEQPRTRRSAFSRQVAPQFRRTDDCRRRGD